MSIRKNDGVMYMINDSGELGERFTGWTRNATTDARFYYRDGVRVTGVQFLSDNGDRYVFDNDGTFMGKRTSAAEYSIVFANNHNISLSENDAVEFSVISDNFESELLTWEYNEFLGEYMTWDYSWERNFSLFIRENGKWVHIPYHPVTEITTFDYNTALRKRSGETIDARQAFSMFNTDTFSYGLYRVVITLYRVNNKIVDDAGIPTSQTIEVRGEFNLIP